MPHALLRSLELDEELDVPAERSVRGIRGACPHPGAVVELGDEQLRMQPAQRVVRPLGKLLVLAAQADSRLRRRSPSPSDSAPGPPRTGRDRPARAHRASHCARQARHGLLAHGAARAAWRSRNGETTSSRLCVQPSSAKGQAGRPLIPRGQNRRPWKPAGSSNSTPRSSSASSRTASARGLSTVVTASRGSESTNFERGRFRRVSARERRAGVPSKRKNRVPRSVEGQVARQAEQPVAQLAVGRPDTGSPTPSDGRSGAWSERRPRGRPPRGTPRVVGNRPGARSDRPGRRDRSRRHCDGSPRGSRSGSPGHPRSHPLRAARTRQGRSAAQADRARTSSRRHDRARIPTEGEGHRAANGDRQARASAGSRRLGNGLEDVVERSARRSATGRRAVPRRSCRPRARGLACCEGEPGFPS